MISGERGECLFYHVLLSKIILTTVNEQAGKAAVTQARWGAVDQHLDGIQHTEGEALDVPGIGARLGKMVISPLGDLNRLPACEDVQWNTRAW